MWFTLAPVSQQVKQDTHVILCSYVQLDWKHTSCLLAIHTVLTTTTLLALCLVPLLHALLLLLLQTLQNILSAPQQDLEVFLTQVYRAIAGAAPLKDKVSSWLVHFIAYRTYTELGFFSAVEQSTILVIIRRL